jgi:hypothetical protein
MSTKRHLMVSILLLFTVVFTGVALCTERASPEAGAGDISEGSPTPYVPSSAAAGEDLPPPPDTPVRLLFIHHSCGENWLSDWSGGLGIALRDNNYVVSDTNYGWGPIADNEGTPLGDLTDIGYWWTWFRSPRSAEFMDHVYRENDQHAEYTRLESVPPGENEIIMFKSCFPNSALQGSPNAPVPSIDANLLKGDSSWTEYHTVANAKGIYLDLLEYFRTRPDKLFIVVTAPPVSDSAHATNARAFNEWLVNDWLDGYSQGNVYVFDFYNVLTTNGGNKNTNDLNREGGNHHRWWKGDVQHQVQSQRGTAAYASGRDDDHPTEAGNQKATAEFVPLLNYYYHQWRS